MFLPYLAYFDIFNYNNWECLKRPFMIPKGFSVPYPFGVALLKKWSSPTMVDPPISRLNKATIIPVEESPSFKDPVDRKAESIACTRFTIDGLALQPVLAECAKCL